MALLTQLANVLYVKLKYGNSRQRAFSAMLEVRLSCIRSASEETMAVLEEVILLAFQQCVYYITKVTADFTIIS